MKPHPVRVEAARPLTTAQEIALLEAVVAARPDAGAMAAKLASLLIVADRFGEALALLEGPKAAPASFYTAMLRFQAHISIEDAAHDEAACVAAKDAFALAEDDIARAEALADLGKAQHRLGGTAEAERNWLAALALDPHDKNASKRIAATMLERGEAAELVDLTGRLMAQGAGHSRLLAARALALSQMGDQAGARDVGGLDRFWFQSQIEAPSEWDSLEAFNAALAEEVTNHPALRYDRYGTASSETWRVDEPLTGNPPAIAALQVQLAKAVDGFIADIGDSDHPWARAKPEQCKLHSWCVITDGIGHETWHVHQFGWLSGVYYVAVPERVRIGNSEAGCIAFGIDNALVGERNAADYGETLLRPEPGMLIAFPSHTYHRTFAHHVEEKRIAIAFDIRPD